METKAVIPISYGLEVEVQHRGFFASMSSVTTIEVIPINKGLPKFLVDNQTTQIVKSKRHILVIALGTAQVNYGSVVLTFPFCNNIP